PARKEAASASSRLRWALAARSRVDTEVSGAASAHWASDSGEVKTDRARTLSQDSAPDAKTEAMAGRSSRDRATRTISAAVRQAMPRRMATQLSMEAHPSSAQALRSSQTRTSSSRADRAEFSRAWTWSRAAPSSSLVHSANATRSMPAFYQWGVTTKAQSAAKYKKNWIINNSDKERAGDHARGRRRGTC